MLGREIGAVREWLRDHPGERVSDTDDGGSVEVALFSHDVQQTTTRVRGKEFYGVLGLGCGRNRPLSTVTPPSPLAALLWELKVE